MNKIPKIVHYCWFGKKDKPKFIRDCIKTWNDVLVDYEIREWNEENFDINCNRYVREAYRLGKFAFVSDYVRAFALYTYGGIYLDTDVKVFKKFDDILSFDSFWGFEERDFIATSTIGASPNNEIIKELLDSYSTRWFVNSKGKKDMLTNVAVVTEMFKNRGYILNGKKQSKEGLGVLLPQEYFSPYDYINCYSKRTEKTYTEHYYYKSWLPASTRFKAFVKRNASNIIGGENMNKIRKVLAKGN